MKPAECSSRPHAESLLLGTSTSALQNEGARATRAATVWDRLADEGRIVDGTDPSMASEHLTHLDEDVALIADLGVAAHRFSISWARVMPDDRHTVSEAGLDHYDRLVDLLLDNDVEPIANLHHRDMPTRHHDEGGWNNPATVDAFLDFTGAAAARLGDRVQIWSTLHDRNDPAADDRSERDGASARLADVHRRARHIVRAHCPGGRIGLDVRPENARSIDADHTDIVFVVHDGPTSALKTTLTTMRHLHPGLPVFVMEQGVASHEGIDLDGHYADDDRIAELTAHVEVLTDAQRAGALIEGHLTPLLDGFEWAEGLRRRTGLIRVDFETEQRTPKASYRWYRSLASQGSR